MTAPGAPLLTIAIPTYNRAVLLKDCLERIAEQLGEGVEVVVCDNASTDATPAAIAEFARRVPVLRGLRNETNVGTDANILRCLRESRGRFVLLFSDDDVLLPGSVARILETVRRWSGAGLVYLNSANFSGDYDPARLGAPLYRLDADRVFRDKNEFLRFLSVQATFMSALILNRALFERIPDPERFVGTNLLQAHVAVSCAGAGDVNAVIARPCVAYRAGNSGGYNLYRVFAGNWKTVLFETGAAAGFSRRTLRAVYAKTIRSFLRPMTLEMKAARTGFDSSGLGALFRLTWTYPSAWLFLYPFLLLPAGLARPVQGAVSRVKAVLSR